jgi:two-component system, NarL family, sensor histidine kinase BarA
MSYRSFKRLLGESSLERKSRFLLGAVTLALISSSFWLYARFTAHLAYDATANSSRLLASQVLYNYHVENQEARKALEAFQESAEKRWGEALSGYQYTLLKPHSRKPDFKFKPDEKKVLDKFIDNPNESEEISYLPAENQFLYYSVIPSTRRRRSWPQSAMANSTRWCASSWTARRLKKART